jgi:hypothetical protein
MPPRSGSTAATPTDPGRPSGSASDETDITQERQSPAADPGGLPTFQIGCKLDATSSTAGRQEVWLYPNIDQPSATPTPVEVTGFELPAGTAHGQFAQRFPDGGDYWSLTRQTGGWLSMWIDPRTGGGPGELMAGQVTADIG